LRVCHVTFYNLIFARNAMIHSRAAIVNRVLIHLKFEVAALTIVCCKSYASKDSREQVLGVIIGIMNAETTDRVTRFLVLST